MNAPLHREMPEAALDSTRNKVFATAESSWLDLSAALARWSSPTPTSSPRARTG